MIRYALLFVMMLATAANAQLVYLKQSTNSQVVWLGPFLDSVDGDSEENSLSIANTDIKLRKQGATAAVSKNSGGATFDANGYYYCTLDSTDTNTQGNLVIACHKSGALAVKTHCYVLSSTVYDWWASTGVLPVNVTQYGGTNGTFASGRPEVNVSHFGGSAGTFSSGIPAVNSIQFSGSSTAADNAETNFTTNWDGVNGMLKVDTEFIQQTDPTDWLPNQNINNVNGSVLGNVDGKVIGGGATAITGIGVWAAGASGGAILLSSGYTVPPTAAQVRTEIDSNSTKLADIVADTNELQTDWANGGRLDLLIDAIKAKSDNLPSDPADASDIAASFSTTNGKIDAVDDYIDTEVASIKAKTDNLPSDPADASDLAAFLTAIKGVTDKVDTGLEQDGLVYRFTTNMLEQAPAGGGGSCPTAEEIVAAVLNAALADFDDVGSVGKGIADAGAAGNPWNYEFMGKVASDWITGIDAAIRAGITSVRAPVLDKNTLSIIQGDDYPASLISFKVKWSGPSITGATAVFTCQPNSNYTANNGTGVVTMGTITIGDYISSGADAGKYPLTLVLTGSETGGLTGTVSTTSNYFYRIHCTVDGKRHTIGEGPMLVAKKLN